MAHERFPRQTENERTGGQHGIRNIQNEEGERQLKSDTPRKPARRRASRDDSSSRPSEDEAEGSGRRDPESK